MDKPRKYEVEYKKEAVKLAKEVGASRQAFYNHLANRPPRVPHASFNPYILPHLLCTVIGLGLFGSLTLIHSLICDFCSSDRSFSSIFLQLSSHNGQP